MGRVREKSQHRAERCSGQLRSPNHLIHSNILQGKVPKYSMGKQQHAKILATLRASLPKVDDRLGQFRLKEGLEQVVELAREGNRYLNEHEPWRLYKTDVHAAGEILGVSIQIVASLGILLQPFLPSASKKICLCLTGRLAFRGDPLDSQSSSLERGFALSNPCS